jgi:serum amyloid A protein
LQSAKEKYAEVKETLIEAKEYVSDFYGGVNDFIDTYDEMKTANWKNSDKYFHSKANYKATLRGPRGEAAAIKMSNLREITDQYIKGDSRASSIADQKANVYGRQQAHRRANFIINNDNMRFIIHKYRPLSLPNKY